MQSAVHLPYASMSAAVPLPLGQAATHSFVLVTMPSSGFGTYRWRLPSVLELSLPSRVMPPPRPSAQGQEKRTVMHLAWQLTSPGAHAFRQAAMAACCDDWAESLLTTEGAAVDVGVWAETRAAKAPTARMEKRILWGLCD